jgi:DNA-binding PadR family transcriptional regulator
MSDNNRPAKFYRLTTVGRRRLREEVRTWSRFSEALTRLVES